MDGRHKTPSQCKFKRKFKEFYASKNIKWGLTDSHHGNIGQLNKYICNYVIYVQIILTKTTGRNGIFVGAV
jgi:hypothetical protein